MTLPTRSDSVPDSTAVRVALWRALHLQIDGTPHILADDLALKLVDPADGWKNRPDMHPEGTAPYRASIVTRARFIEDMVTEDVLHHHLSQYVLLGAGLDTFAYRHQDIASRLAIFEIDKPQTLEWKQHQLQKLHIPLPKKLRFVPVHFGANDSWWEHLVASGFNPQLKSLLTSLGVSMYLPKSAIIAMLEQIKSLAPGSRFVMTFMLPLDLVDPQDRDGYKMSLQGAERSGTPFVSFFAPQEMLDLAKNLGFKKIQHLSVDKLNYLKNRKDHLRASTGEELLIIDL